MKNLLFVFLLFASVLRAQETPPTGVNFKTIPTYTFKYYTSDSTVWMYKGSTYGWNSLASLDDPTFTTKITTPAVNIPTGATVNYVWQCTNAAIGSGQWASVTSGQTYKGTWNANTNTPTLADGSGTAGWYYRCTVGDTIDLGSGNIIFTVGDDAYYNGSVWQRVPAGASQWVTSGNDIYYNVGNVAIGSTATTAPLGFGTAYNSGAITNETVTNKIRLYDGGTNNNYGIGVSSGKLTYGVPATYAHNFYIGSTSVLSLTSSLLSGSTTLRLDAGSNVGELQLGGADARLRHATSRNLYLDIWDGTDYYNLLHANGTTYRVTLAETEGTAQIGASTAPNKLSVYASALTANNQDTYQFGVGHATGLSYLTQGTNASGAYIQSWGGLNLYINSQGNTTYFGDNISVGGTVTATGGNSTQWNTAYTHSQIAGGNSVHVSTDENTQWDAGYAHSQVAGGNSVHVSTDENTQWDAAYTHSTDNSLAHSDYLRNNINDATSGTLTATNFILSSDRKLKENIKPIYTTTLKGIEFVQFNLKSEPGQLRYGVVAQDVEKIAPELVRTDKDGFKSVAYLDLLIAKVAELEQRVSELEKANKRQVKRDWWFYNKCKRHEK